MKSILFFLLTITAVTGLLGASTAAAGTPDGFTPAVEAVCDIDKGTNRFGLCNAYCEAMDCDSGSNASAKACSATLANYLKKSGGLEPPCEQQNECPCVGRVDAVDALLDPTAGFAFSCLNILNPADNFDPLQIVCAVGFDCVNDGVGNFVGIGTTVAGGVSFCGGNLDGQDPAFFGIRVDQLQACTVFIENSAFGFGACFDVP